MTSRTPQSALTAMPAEVLQKVRASLAASWESGVVPLSPGSNGESLVEKEAAARILTFFAECVDSAKTLLKNELWEADAYYSHRLAFSEGLFTYSECAVSVHDDEGSYYDQVREGQMPARLLENLKYSSETDRLSTSCLGMEWTEGEPLQIPEQFRPSS